MGRYKRNQSNRTKTLLANRYAKTNKPQREYGNRNRLPEISDRVKTLLQKENIQINKPIKDVRISRLVGDMVLSLKKRGKYVNLLNSYGIDKVVFLNDYVLPSRTYNLHYGLGIKLFIGNKLTYYGKVPTYFEVNDLYNTLLGRLCMIDTLLVQPKYRRFPRVGKNVILEYYAKDEIEKMNIKPLPNELVFACLFGTVFALCGLIIIASVLLKVFGIVLCIIFLFFVAIVASDKVDDF